MLTTPKRPAGLWLLLILPLAVSGCASGAGDACLPWQPIWPTAADVDVISDELVAQILAHNETGAMVCGWER